ncbi:MAG TPA: YkgJ family cysteine cluster protein [Spirochaetota bacterium]|nr:YkgJ family cysteine cluster protein [Spirochaetota bacterium]HNT10148.1 YkgJ family cysteine cluster protein [Spirochaetota bacterium]
MNCNRCGACCIAPSISSAIPGMPGGKPAGVRCIHLTADRTCGIYDLRPPVCREFTPTMELCGASRDEALANLARLEVLTK